MNSLKRLAYQLPARWQNELKRIYFSRQIRRGTFATAEPEYHILSQLIRADDWVIDVGANVGHYTKRFSELVGPGGRVIAFEPVPATFAFLAANVSWFAWPNVTLVNAAVSDGMALVGMSVPRAPSGLSNYYQAHLSAVADSAFSVLALSVDNLCINRRVALIKIDAEGHELSVLHGMQRLLTQYHPVLIVETASRDVAAHLSGLGYAAERLRDSPNIVFKATG